MYKKIVIIYIKIITKFKKCIFEIISQMRINYEYKKVISYFRNNLTNLK